MWMNQQATTETENLNGDPADCRFYSCFSPPLQDSSYKRTETSVPPIPWNQGVKPLEQHYSVVLKKVPYHTYSLRMPFTKSIEMSCDGVRSRLKEVKFRVEQSTNPVSHILCQARLVHVGSAGIFQPWNATKFTVCCCVASYCGLAGPDPEMVWCEVVGTTSEQ
ncbi:hypothetical protein AOLI_G00259650 [Acnodon oligacanthus]